MLDLLLLHRTNTNHIEINVSFTLLNCKIPYNMCVVKTVVREKLAKLKYDPKLSPVLAVS